MHSSVFSEYIKQSVEEQIDAAKTERGWSEEKIAEKLEETDTEYYFSNFLLHSEGAFEENCSDRKRTELFQRFNSVFQQRLRYKNYLRDHEEGKRRKDETLKASIHTQIFQMPFDEIYKLIHQKLCKHITQIEMKGDHQKNDKQYKHGVSLYSQAILELTDWIRGQKKMLNGGVSEYLFYAAMHKKYCNILSKRAECLWILQKYEKCLIDLNKIMSLCVMKRDRIEDQKTERYFELFFELKHATWQRVEVWLKIGNFANTINDLMFLMGNEMSSQCEFTKLASQRTKELVDNGLHQYPSKEMLKKCNINSFSLKLNKYSNEGWIQLHPKYNNKPLLRRHGHIMIEHNSSIYIFGGTCIDFGGFMFSSSIQRKIDENWCFIKVDIDINSKTYVSERLLFPKKMRYYLIGNKPLTQIRWKRMLTGIKWRDNMIIFGGHNKPFQNALIYNFNNKNWKCLNIKCIPKYLQKCFEISNHSAVIMNDIMYVFGGDFNQNETNLFCALNLNTKKWKILTMHNQLNIEKDCMEIPGSRLDHIMWTDSDFGINGSVYIGFGNHFREGLDSEIHRLDIYRFDVYKNKWYEIQRNGNYPVYRGESGFTQTNNNGIIVFGGYSSMLMNIDKETKHYNTYSYFADCYEYLSKHRKWIMIQSKLFPAHRAYSGICLIKKQNILCLHGGYHGGGHKKQCVYNDIWILNLNKLNGGYPKEKHLKICKYRKCHKTQNEITLFKCKGINTDTNRKCVTVYCSKYCQKRDWIQHRLHCKR